MKARASRIAISTASVPDVAKRTTWRRAAGGQALGQLGLARMLGGVDVGRALRHRVDDRLGRVAQDRGPIAQHVVDMDVAIDIVEPRALAAGEEQRHRRAGVAHVAADAAGQMPFRPFVERDRLVGSACSEDLICDHK